MEEQGSRVREEGPYKKRGEGGERDRGGAVKGGGEARLREKESMRKGGRGQEKEVMYVMFFSIVFVFIYVFWTTGVLFHHFNQRSGQLIWCLLPKPQPLFLTKLAQ